MSGRFQSLAEVGEYLMSTVLSFDKIFDQVCVFQANVFLCLLNTLHERAQ